MLTNDSQIIVTSLANVTRSQAHDSTYNYNRTAIAPAIASIPLNLAANLPAPLA
jgi:hypothetical protein